LVLSCWVPGRPKTKGSLTVINGKRNVVSDTPASKRWRSLMAYQAAALVKAPLEGPVVVVAVFHLPLHPTSGQAWAGRVGDLDKLARNLLDALTDAGVYGDDVQVTRLICEKVPADMAGRGPGVDLRVLVP
jgi:Holliday junction resolvase RusA-like endonuclease